MDTDKLNEKLINKRREEFVTRDAELEKNSAILKNIVETNTIEKARDKSINSKDEFSRYENRGLALYIQRRENSNAAVFSSDKFLEKSSVLSGKKTYKAAILSRNERFEIARDTAGTKKQRRKAFNKRITQIQKETNKEGKSFYEKSKMILEGNDNSYYIPFIKDQDLNSKYVSKKVFSKKVKLANGKKKTNRQLYDEVRNGDYSNFESMDVVLRSRLAYSYLENYSFPRINQNSISELDLEAIVDSIYEKEGVSGLLNPLLRTGIHLASEMERPDRTFPNLGLSRQVFGLLDESISKRVLEETIIKKPTLKEMKTLHNVKEPSLRASKKEKDEYNKSMDEIVESMEQNVDSQIYTAKLLLCSHLGKHRRRYASTDFVHLSDVDIILPLNSQGLGDNFVEERTSLDKLRSKSRINVNKKLGTWKTMFGKNIAVGGLGNNGITGAPGTNSQLNNDGSCGHLHVLRKIEDKEKPSILRVRFEGKSIEKTNQLGHEYGSSLGGYATCFGGYRIKNSNDERYKDKKIDLSGMDGAEFDALMKDFEMFYRNLLTDSKPENALLLKGIASRLVGRKMDEYDLRDFIKMVHDGTKDLKNKELNKEQRSEEDPREKIEENKIEENKISAREKAAQSLADSDNDFISDKLIPMEIQVLKSSQELINYKEELNKKRKRINKKITAWLDTHIRHWQEIESLREKRAVNKPPHTLTVKRNGKKIDIDNTFVLGKDDEVILDNVKQEGKQSHKMSCWSRVAQALLNYEGVDIDQTTIRAFRKRGITPQNYNNKEFGSPGVFNDEMGSLDIDIQELILQITDNAGLEVRHYDCTVPQEENNLENMRNIIMEDIRHIILEQKKPIAMLKGIHYVTIVGFRGETLLCKDPKYDNFEDKQVYLREIPLRNLPTKVIFEWIKELKVDDDGRCEEVEQKSLEQEKESNNKWELKNGKYRLKSLNDGTYQDESVDNGIGDIFHMNYYSGFTVSKFFRFNTNMK